MLVPPVADARMIMQRCPKLIELDLSDSNHLTDATILEVVKRLKHLEHLWLSRCFNIQPDILL